MIVYTLEQHWQILRQIDLQNMAILAKKKIIFSDEAHFDIGGYVNKKSCCIWGTENPHAYIIGVFFFEHEQEEERAMLNEFLFTKIEEEDIANIWIQ